MAKMHISLKKDILGNVIELLDSTGATVVKYSRAFKIGMGEFWSQGIGKFGTAIEIGNLAWDVYDFARSVFDDPNESNWILY